MPSSFVLSAKQPCVAVVPLTQPFGYLSAELRDFAAKAWGAPLQEGHEWLTLSEDVML